MEGDVVKVRMPEGDEEGADMRMDSLQAPELGGCPNISSS